MTIVLRNLVTTLAVVFFALAGMNTVAEAKCNPWRQSCAAQVQGGIATQDKAAIGKKQWGANGVTQTSCNAASAEMDRSAARARAANSNDPKDCSKYCRQLREGMNRWTACYKAGYAPAPNWSGARTAGARLNCGF